MGILVLALLAGCRDVTIGTDTSGYVQSIFEEAVSYKRDLKGLYTIIIISNQGSFEELYILLNYVVAQFADNINVYMFVAHWLIVGVMVFAIKRIRINITWAIYIFLMAFMATTLNVARQSLAMAFCYLAFALLVTGSKMRWVLLANVVALGFHHSAFIFLVPIIGYKIIIKYFHLFRTKKMKLFVVLGCVLLIWFWGELLSSMSDWGLLNEKYMDRYGSSDKYGNNIPISLIALTTFNLFAFYCVRKQFRKHNYIFSLYVEYILLVSFLLCFVALVSTFAVRINVYFINLCVIFVPYMISLGRKKMLRAAIVFFYLFYWIMGVVVANLSETFPYTSKVLGIS